MELLTQWWNFVANYAERGRLKREELVELYGSRRSAPRNLIFIAPRTAVALKIKLSGIFKRGANRLIASASSKQFAKIPDISRPSRIARRVNYSLPCILADVS